ncbi:hypothetical protein evm_010296 [Chilo suppressalis]|nr:hypothetical protein evm_010296 [Chilo suppressalis]
MYLKNFLKVFIEICMITIFIRTTKCTIAGLSYMDPLNFRPLPDKDQMDPCNPLYWYPKAIPEYCYLRSTPKPQRVEAPEGVVPLPIPVPIPMPNIVPPIQPPIIQPMPVVDLTPQYPVPIPIIPPLPPVPFGVPLVPSNPMMPVAGIPYPPSSYPYPYPSQQIGMVPGIRGIVSEDGGINILPFSDVYSDMLESHKNKMLRKRLRKLLGDYDRRPRLKRRHRKMF